MTQSVDYDVVVLGSATLLADVRAALGDEAAGDRIVLVRLEGVTAVTWHRFDASTLLARMGGAAGDERLSKILALDTISRVPVAGGRDGYGVLIVDEQVIGFALGTVESAAPGARRSVAIDEILRDDPVFALEALDLAEAGEGPPITAKPEPLPATLPAYPTIAAPTTVTVDEQFDVTVGLELEKSAETLGELVVTNLDPAASDVVLDVTIVGPFEVVRGRSTGHVTLDRTTGATEEFTLALIAGAPPDSFDPSGSGAWIAKITVFFDHKGQPVGEATRNVRVNVVGRPAITAESNASQPVTEVIPVGETGGTDLTIWIERVNAASGEFDLSLVSPHLTGPRITQHLALGTDHSGYSHRIIERVEKNLANWNSDNSLEAIGMEISRLLHDPVHDALRTVWRKVAEERGPTAAPTVLLLTTDASVPWELMWLRIDPATEGFLGALADVGRWPLRQRDHLTGDSLALDRIGVMVGEYGDTFLADELPRAKEEGDQLVENYQGHLFTADDSGLDGLLAGLDPDNLPFNAVHFAGHGENKPDLESSLLYNDGQAIDVGMLESADVAKQQNGAFLFVNACQIGTAEVVLNQYAGLAGYAVAGGFRGCVAPLWSVADSVAKEVSLGFYRAMADEMPSSAAGYLRLTRRNFKQTDDNPAHTTWMAYVYYGHPAMAVSGPTRRRAE